MRGKTGSALSDVVHYPEGIKGTGCDLKEWTKGLKKPFFSYRKISGIDLKGANLAGSIEIKQRLNRKTATAIFNANWRYGSSV